MTNQFMILTDGNDFKNRSQIFLDISEERIRQLRKWGIQSHGINSWLMILGEEFGEACKAGNEAYFRDNPLDSLRKELIQTAAVCVAIIEAIDGVGDIS